MNTDPAPTVHFTHLGLDWEIPADLIQTQKDWYAVESECARLVGHDAAGWTAACVRRQELAMALHRHPWLDEHRAAGRRHQADTALKAAAKTT